MSDKEKDIEEAPKKKQGRPFGSRNKSILMQAQIKIDDLSLVATEYLEALMKNDLVMLGSKDDVPYSIRFNATKEILAKGIANEKEKDAALAPAQGGATTDEKGEVVHTGPVVFATAK